MAKLVVNIEADLAHRNKSSKIKYQQLVKNFIAYQQKSVDEINYLTKQIAEMRVARGGDCLHKSDIVRAKSTSSLSD